MARHHAKKTLSAHLTKMARENEGTPEGHASSACEEEKSAAVEDLKLAESVKDRGEVASEESIAEIERIYWRIVEKGEPCTVEYGSDISTSEFGSGFQDKDCF